MLQKLVIRLIVPPLHRQMRSLERPGPFPSGCASGNLDGALELPSAPPGGGTLQNSRRCPWPARSGNGALILPGEVMGALPKFLFLSLHSVPRMGLIFKSLPGRRACFLRNLTLSVYYCLSLVCFISCYLICDSEPTKNSFQLRCSPHAISSQQNHILHY